jgi:hypothetical protein
MRPAAITYRHQCVVDVVQQAGDSRMLQDGIRVLTRTMQTRRADRGPPARPQSPATA